jgi:hypothetical protein
MKRYYYCHHYFRLYYKFLHNYLPLLVCPDSYHQISTLQFDMHLVYCFNTLTIDWADMNIRTCNNGRCYELQTRSATMYSDPIGVRSPSANRFYCDKIQSNWYHTEASCQHGAGECHVKWSTGTASVVPWKDKSISKVLAVRCTKEIDVILCDRQRRAFMKEKKAK